MDVWLASLQRLTLKALVGDIIILNNVICSEFEHQFHLQSSAHREQGSRCSNEMPIRERTEPWRPISLLIRPANSKGNSTDTIQRGNQ